MNKKDMRTFISRLLKRFISQKLEQLDEVDLSHATHINVKSWKPFLSDLNENKKVKLKCFKFEVDSIEDNYVIMAEALCKIEDVNITTKSNLRQLREITHFIQKIANMPIEKVKLRKLSICPSLSHLDTVTLTRAIMKLETVSLVGSSITPLQENSLYAKIIEREHLILKSLDLRRTSTYLDNINGNLQAAAIVRLVEFKGTVNEDQAKKIIDNLYVTQNPITQKLLIVVRKSFDVPGNYKCCDTKLINISSKLLKLRIINDV